MGLLEREWRNINDNFSSHLGCLPFAVYNNDGLNKTLAMNLTVSMFCPAKNLDKVSPETVRRCEHPSNQSLDDHTIHYSPKHRLIFRNYHCLRCYDPSLNATDIRRYPPIRNCSTKVRQQLLRGQGTQRGKMQLYITKCLPTISSTINSYLYGLNESLGISSGKYMNSMSACHQFRKVGERLTPMKNASALQRPTLEWLCAVAPSQAMCTNTSVYPNAFCALLNNDTDYRCDNCSFDKQEKKFVPMDLPPLSILLDFNTNRFISSTTFQEIHSCQSLTSNEVDQKACSVGRCGRNLLPYNLITYVQSTFCHDPRNYIEGKMRFYWRHSLTYSEDKDIYFFICDLLLRSMDLLTEANHAFCVTLKKSFMYEKNMEFLSSGIGMQVTFRALDTINGLIEFRTTGNGNSSHLQEAMAAVMQNVSTLGNQTDFYCQEATIRNGPLVCDPESNSTNIGGVPLVELRYNGSFVTNRSCKVDLKNCRSEEFKKIDPTVSSHQVRKSLKAKYNGLWFLLNSDHLLHLDCSSSNTHAGNDVIDVINSLITYTCIPASLVGLIVTQAVYGWFPELRSVPSMCTLNLVACNILLLTSFLLTTLMREKLPVSGPLCKALAVANHLFTLLTFSWCSTLSFMAVKAFSSMQAACSKVQRPSDVRRKVLKAAFVAYLPAALYTLACLVSDLAPYDSTWKVTYGQPHSGLCILNNRPVASILIGINGPACLLLLTSVINFCVTLSFILKSMRAARAVRSKEENEKILLRSSVNLGVLLGLAWLLPMLAIWTNSRALGVIGNALIATQGLFLSLSLLLRPHVRVLIRRSLCGAPAAASE